MIILQISDKSENGGRGCPQKMILIHTKHIASFLIIPIGMVLRKDHAHAPTPCSIGSEDIKNIFLRVISANTNFKLKFLPLKAI